MSEETENRGTPSNPSSSGDSEEKSLWLKPQHDPSAQRLSDVLHDVTRLVSDWIWEVSPALTFVYMSPRIFETLGFHPAELRDKTLLDLGTPVNENSEPVEINWRRPFRDQLFITKNKLNDERIFELSGIPVFDNATGEFRGVRGTATDTTEQRETAATLERARDEAHAINRLRADFLDTLADEIREPLDAILRSTTHISTLAQQNDIIQYTKEIKHAGNRVERLINQVHSLARLETGQIDFSLESLVPENIVDECLEDIAPLAREHKVRILGVHQWDGRIAVDRQYFKQILTNLITGGIKYNRVGGQLTIASSREDTKRYRLCITDEGENIPENSQEEIFRPFSRLRNPDEDDGPGLAMAITKQLVEGMDGSIGYCPGPSEGSTFWIEFPVVSRIE